MRIGCDLDGVLADLHRRFAAAALQLFPDLDAALVSAPEAGASPPGGDGRDEVPAGGGTALVHSLSRRRSDAVWRELCAIEDFWETLEEIEAGAIQRLAQLANDRRWEIMFVTSRPTVPGRTVQRQSQRWLERLGFPLPSVYVVEGSRGRIADALGLDVVIDDRPDNCLDVVLESKARAILVWRGSANRIPASATRMGIGVVPTVSACFDVLVEASSDASEPDWRARLKRLLGIQTRSVTKA